MKFIGKQESKNVNTGIRLLRIWMCFEVILVHFGQDMNSTHSIFGKILLYFEDKAVPVFMLLAFMFSNPSEMLTSGKITKRIRRLAIPQIGWSVAYWGGYNLLNVLFHWGLKLGVGEFLKQIFLGHSKTMNATMWFQVILIVVTVISTSIYLGVKSKTIANGIMAILTGICIFTQYSGINNFLFSAAPYEVKYSYGRFVYMFPYVMVGYLLKRCVNYIPGELRRYIDVALMILLSIIALFEPFRNLDGFGYQGIEVLSISIILIILFWNINITSGVMKGIIGFISKYTPGIYFMHRGVGTIIMSTWMQPFFTHYDMALCILLFVVCLWIAHLMFLSGNKLLKALVI